MPAAKKALKLSEVPPEVAAVREELLTEVSNDQAARMVGPEFDAYCGAVARLRDAQARIAEEELIVPDAKNNPVVHPAYAVERLATEDLRKWGDKFRPRKGR